MAVAAGTVPAYRASSPVKTKAAEKYLKRISPAFKRTVQLLNNYKQKGVITSYFLSSSVRREDFRRPSGDEITLAVSLNKKYRPNYPNELGRLLITDIERGFFIQIGAFGHVYRIGKDRIEPTTQYKGREFITPREFDDIRINALREYDLEDFILIRLGNHFGEITSNPAKFLVELYRKTRRGLPYAASSPV